MNVIQEVCRNITLEKNIVKKLVSRMMPWNYKLNKQRLELNWIFVKKTFKLFRRSLMSRVNCVMGLFSKVFMFLEIDYCLDVSQSSMASTRPDRCDRETEAWVRQESANHRSWQSSLLETLLLGDTHYRRLISSLSNSLNITLKVMTKWGWLETTLLVVISLPPQYLHYLLPSSII